VEAIALLLVLLLCFGAWIALSLGLAKHQTAALGRPLARAASRRLRALGWALLAAGLVLMVVARGWELGPVLWACALMVTAVVWTLVLTRLSAAPHS
jgi:hypothetical protein